MERTDNIETISAIKRKGSLSFGSFESMEKEFEFMSEKLKLMREYTYDTILDNINMAGLDSIDFEVNPIHLLETDTQNRFDDFTIEGADDEYKYIISAYMHYPDDEEHSEDSIEIPEYMATSIVRMAANNPEILYQFDFEKQEWEKLSVKDATGFTKKQVEIIKSEDTVKREILIMYQHMYGTISDKKLDKLFVDNKNIISLYSQTKRFTRFAFKDQNTIILMQSTCVAGNIVKYANGKYSLNAGTEYLMEPIVETESEDDMREVLYDIFDRAFYDDMIALVPLSEESIAIVRQNGAVEYMHPSSSNTNDATKEEKGVLKRFFDEISKLSEEEKE